MNNRGITVWNFKTNIQIGSHPWRINSKTLSIISTGKTTEYISSHREQMSSTSITLYGTGKFDQMH